MEKINRSSFVVNFSLILTHFTGHLEFWNFLRCSVQTSRAFLRGKSDDLRNAQWKQWCAVGNLCRRCPCSQDNHGHTDSIFFCGGVVCVESDGNAVAAFASSQEHSEKRGEPWTHRPPSSAAMVSFALRVSAMPLLLLSAAKDAKKNAVALVVTMVSMAALFCATLFCAALFCASRTMTVFLEPPPLSSMPLGGRQPLFEPHCPRSPQFNKHGSQSTTTESEHTEFSLRKNHSWK